MSAKIDISPEQLDIVQAILRAHLPKGTLAWAFGSRVTWTAKPYSDLDLAIEAAAPLPLEVMGDLQEAFESSDLPWRVDVIDLKSVSPEFRAIVERQRVPADWSRKPVSELCELIVDCVNRTAPVVAFETPYKMIRTTNVKDGRINLQDARCVTKDTFDRWARRAAVLDGDVVLTREAPIGEVGFVQDIGSVFLGQRIMQYRPNPTLINPRYFYYGFRSRDLQNQFGSHNGSGSVVSHIRVADCHKFEMDVPLREEQDCIVDLLGSLDDKIELNRQMNQTLEALARAVFEDWFVGFGPTRRKMAGETDPAAILGGLLPPDSAAPIASIFPDQFGENGLPLGWEPKSLGDVVEPRKGRNITKKTVAHGTVPVVAGGLSPAYYHDTANVSGPVITASASGANAGFVRLYNQDIWASDCSYISREQTEYLFTIYALLSSRQDEIYSMQQGAAQPHVYPSDLKRLAIADAPPPIWQACEELLSPMFEQLASNEQENQTLAATRDLLLPKLMSGELRLVEGEALV